MKLGIIAGYSGRKLSIPMDSIHQAESLGYDSIWTSEAYGSDAITPAAWILAQTTKIKVGTAIMQMPARTPTMAAMTAMTLAQLSEGRFIVGLGASGPQVVEGWHGERYGRPVTRLKEYTEVMKQVFAREGALTYEGKEYQMPYKGPGATGLGKPLKSILHCEEDIPIYAATITPPKGLRLLRKSLTASSPSGWIPQSILFFRNLLRKGLHQLATSLCLILISHLLLPALWAIT